MVEAQIRRARIVDVADRPPRAFQRFGEALACGGRPVAFVRDERVVQFPETAFAHEVGDDPGLLAPVFRGNDDNLLRDAAWIREHEPVALADIAFPGQREFEDPRAVHATSPFRRDDPSRLGFRIAPPVEACETHKSSLGSCQMSHRGV